MKVLLVDDDQAILLILAKMIRNIEYVEIVGSYQTTEDAYHHLIKESVDILFVDISMPRENGIDFAKRARLKIPSLMIIFITAHKEFALDAFEIYAFDYIVKPISQSRLISTLDRAKDRFSLSKQHHKHDCKYKLSIHCFNSLELISSEGVKIKIGSSKSYEVLAYLVLKREKLTSKWEIIEDIFPDIVSNNAETYLNTSVYRLRKAFEPFGLRDNIIYANDGYKLSLNGIYVDVFDFEENIRSKIYIDQHNYEEALKIGMLYQGELFEKKDYIWALPERERLCELYWDYLMKLSKFYYENNRLSFALNTLKEMLIINELDEETHYLLMNIYMQQSKYHLALKQYEKYKEISQDLGVKPGHRILSLSKAIYSTSYDM